MSARIAGRSGIYRLRTWHEAEGQLDSAPREAEAPLALRGDLAGALAFARALAAGPGAVGALRAVLARELGTIHRLEDDDVLRLLAAELASGRLIAARVLPPALPTFDVATDEPEVASSPVPAAQPRTWIEIELVDTEGNAVPGERYWIMLPDGSVREGRLNAQGRAYFGDLDPGECDVRFPDLDNDAVASPGEPAKPKARELPRRRKKTWVEIELIGMDDGPIPGETYRIALPDGSVMEGRLDDRGRARVDGIDPGTCVVTFPALDEEAWEPA